MNLQVLFITFKLYYYCNYIIDALLTSYCVMDDESHESINKSLQLSSTNCTSRNKNKCEYNRHLNFTMILVFKIYSL